MFRNFKIMHLIYAVFHSLRYNTPIYIHRKKLPRNYLATKQNKKDSEIIYHRNSEVTTNF